MRINDNGVYRDAIESDTFEVEDYDYTDQQDPHIFLLSRLDDLEAKITYTAMMTDTLSEVTENV